MLKDVKTIFFPFSQLRIVNSILGYYPLNNLLHTYSSWYIPKQLFWFIWYKSNFLKGWEVFLRTCKSNNFSVIKIGSLELFDGVKQFPNETCVFTRFLFNNHKLALQSLQEKYFENCVKTQLHENT